MLTRLQCTAGQAVEVMVVGFTQAYAGALQEMRGHFRAQVSAKSLAG